MPVEIKWICNKCGKPQAVTVGAGDSGQVPCPGCGAVTLETRNIPGYLYILSNAHMPGLLKIGITTRSIAERVAELTSATGVPSRFAVEAYFESNDPNAHETAIHERLGEHRLPSREFFKVDLGEALAAGRAVTGGEPVGMTITVGAGEDSVSGPRFFCNSCGKPSGTYECWKCKRPCIRLWGPGGNGRRH
jgi:hypothetical protein